MRSELPKGTVTFLFTDVEGSTRLLHELGAETYADALAEHRRVIREACTRESGIEVDTQGDAFFFAFPTAPGALAAASTFTEALSSGPIQVRVGLHTGTPLLTAEGYVGDDVHRAARIAAAGHGGQVLVSASTAQLVGPVVHDLGEHRLKDLSAPERVYQLGEGEFSPLKTLQTTNLPIPQTPFLGREHELGEVVALLARDDVRLLTLTGPGGTGKTRLAAQAAGALAERYPHGVWWVPLAALRDPLLVLESVSQVVGAKNGLASHIADREMLVLLDNFEHVVDAADGLSSLLESCTNLELLVTSREPLHLTGEQEYAVPPFAHEEAVGFFAARARSVDPGFEVDGNVREICRRLDELPLALELAAARVKALSTSQILERLERRLPLLTGGARDAPERQRTLQATIEWSYDLLSPEEQRLFARLSVFAGGCTLEAAEEICDADLDILQSLVEKSLLRFTGERYWMLETIREFAFARLDESSEVDALRGRHAEWCLRLAEDAEPELRGPQAASWLERLDRELGNIRAALDWAIAAERVLGLRLASALLDFWMARDYVSEAGRYLEASWSEDAPVDLQKRALRALGAVANATEDVPRLVATQERRLALARETGDVAEASRALGMLGAAARSGGDLERARQLQEEALELARHTGDPFELSINMANLALVVRDQGDLVEARRLLEEGIVHFRSEGDELTVVWALQQLAETAIRERAYDEARRDLRESLEIAARLGVGWHNLWTVAFLAVERGHSENAAVLAGVVDELAEHAGVPLPSTYAGHILPQRDYMAGLETVRRDLGAARFEALYSDGRSLELDQAVEYALRYLD